MAYPYRSGLVNYSQYKKSFADLAASSDKFLNALSSLAGPRGAPKDRYGEAILFGIDRLATSSFYSEVHSWTADAFRKHFISNLP